MNLRLALDWTPNVNHIGFYVAQTKGYYDAFGLCLSMVDPSVDNYELTPAKKLELGMVDFAICPLETVMSYRTKKTPFYVKAIASIYQEDLSAICVLKSSEINRPADLDGKIYASYKARYEDGIVRQMLVNDGGEGALKISYPEKLGIWDNLLTGRADATWIFLNWEGVAAEVEGLALNNFRMRDYGIPYSYSPVIIAAEAAIKEHQETYHNFLKATRDGFLYAKAHQEEAVTILSEFVVKTDRHIELGKAIESSSEALGTLENWGLMEEQKVGAFLHWLQAHDLEQSKLKAKDLFVQLL